MTSLSARDRPITLRDLHEALKPILEILQRHEARFDSIEQMLKEHGETLRQHGDRLTAIEETIKVLKKFTFDNSARLDRIERILEELRNTRFNEVLTLQDQLVTMIKDRDMEDLMAVGKKDRHEEMLQDHERRLRAIERN